MLNKGFPGGPMVKNPPVNAGDVGSFPGLGRSPGEGNSNSLQYSCLGNSMVRGAWQAIVQGVSRVGHDIMTKQQCLTQVFPQAIRIWENLPLKNTEHWWPILFLLQSSFNLKHTNIRVRCFFLTNFSLWLYWHPKSPAWPGVVPGWPVIR